MKVANVFISGLRQTCSSTEKWSQSQMLKRRRISQVCSDRYTLHFEPSVQLGPDGPPKGVTMLGRWHGTKSGFCLAETEDIKGLYEWISQWSDLLDFTVTPVMDDTELAEVLKRIGS
jgi:hypothetical protein